MKETIYKRIFVIVLDSLGIGAMPDSEKFGDRDVDTFGHILDRMGTLEIPNLQKLGCLLYTSFAEKTNVTKMIV